MSKILVTGGAGFIGCNIVRRLLAEGHEVRVLDNFSTGQRENLEGLDVELIEGDLTSYHMVQRAVKGADYILHQGTLPSVPRSVNDPIASVNVNVIGTVNVLTAVVEEGANGWFTLPHLQSTAILQSCRSTRGCFLPRNRLMQPLSWRESISVGPSTRVTAWRQLSYATSTCLVPIRIPIPSMLLSSPGRRNFWVIS